MPRVGLVEALSIISDNDEIHRINLMPSELNDFSKYDRNNYFKCLWFYGCTLQFMTAELIPSLCIRRTKVDIYIDVYDVVVLHRFRPLFAMLARGEMSCIKELHIKAQYPYIAPSAALLHMFASPFTSLSVHLHSSFRITREHTKMLAALKSGVVRDVHFDGMSQRTKRWAEEFRSDRYKRENKRVFTYAIHILQIFNQCAPEKMPVQIRDRILKYLH
jgi:hypothetical protein